jgi:hypothetical protein
MAIDSLLEVRDTINWVDRTDDRDFASQPSSPILEPVKDKKMPNPRQGNTSISKYFEYVKLYAMGTGKDLDDIEIKEKFINGLSPDNRKRVDEFGTEKPLKELVKHLVRDPTLSTEIQKYVNGGMKQGDESVREFYKKIEWFGEYCGDCKGERVDKFHRGLSPANRDEVKLWGKGLPLDELLDRLETLEELSK